jgi:hypothetical protein
MQNLDHAFRAANLETGSFSDTDAAEGQVVVVMKLVVPGAAKVPALRQHLETARLQLLPASVSSTVPSTALLDLQVSNTAQPTDWSTTATLKAIPGR